MSIDHQRCQHIIAERDEEIAVLRDALGKRSVALGTERSLVRALRYQLGKMFEARSGRPDRWIDLSHGDVIIQCVTVKNDGTRLGARVRLTQELVWVHKNIIEDVERRLMADADAGTLPVVEEGRVPQTIEYDLDLETAQ
jgi:hypothetical protein